MAWFSKTFRTVSVVTAGALTWYYRDKLELGPGDVRAKSETNFGKPFLLNDVLASYTNNFEPSTKWDDNWDRRDPKCLVKRTSTMSEDDYRNRVKKVTPTASRYLVLIRHGQYHTEAKGDELRTLTQLGEKQADLTGQRLKELNCNYSVLINSTMTRAIQTADIIAKHLPGLPRKSSDLLREGAPYPPEPPSGDWKPEAYQFYEDGARIEAAFRKYFHRADSEQLDDQYEVIVCHANVIRYFICRALQVPPEAWLRMSLANGSMSIMRISPSGRVSVRSVGDSGHFPQPLVTFY